MRGTEAPIEAGREIRPGVLGERARELDDVVSRNLRAFHQRAFRYLGNAPDAEDAVQDALLSAYKHVSQFRGQARISTWLTAIVINAARMKLRRRRGVWLSLEEEHTEDGLPWSERIADPRPGPEEVCFTSEAHDRLTEVAKQLSPTLRRTFQLRHIDGLTTKETASLLGVPEGTVKAQVARARAKLAGLLRPKPRRQHSRTGSGMHPYFMRTERAGGASSGTSE
jgi:RNA polymerase sigma-70 factor, ECF subfamily